MKGGFEHFVSTRVGGNSQTSTGYVFQTDYKLDANNRPALDADGRLIPRFVPNNSRVQVWLPQRGATIDIATTSLFATDHWTVSPRLTLDLGLRFEDGLAIGLQPETFTRRKEVARGLLLTERERQAFVGRHTHQQIGHKTTWIGERIELNAMTSDALIEMIECKLQDYGLEKVVPEDDLLAKTYRAFHHSQELRKKFEQIKDALKDAEAEVPRNLNEQVRAILDEHGDLRWDDAVQIVLNKMQLDRVRAEKQKAKRKFGDFTNTDEAEEDDG